MRTQIQFEEAQIKALRRLSSERGQSISDLVRESVDRMLLDNTRAARIERALKVSGKFHSGLSDLSENHDHYLAEAFSE